MAAVADGIALYRIRGENALLLYIGISDDFGRRWKQHAKDQPWWGEVRSLSVDRWYETREDAEAAEAEAIKAERPKYNKEHTVPPVDEESRLADAAAMAVLERIISEDELPENRSPLAPRERAKLRKILENYKAHRGASESAERGADPGVSTGQLAEMHAAEPSQDGSDAA